MRMKILTLSLYQKKKQIDKEEEVQEIVESLKTIHGSSFTGMQLRIWAEMLVSNMYSCTDDPLSTTMLLRAGGISEVKKQSLVFSSITTVCRI